MGINYKRLFFVIFLVTVLIGCHCSFHIAGNAFVLEPAHQGCHMSKGEVSNALIDECEDCPVGSKKVSDTFFELDNILWVIYDSWFDHTQTHHASFIEFNDRFVRPPPPLAFIKMNC